MQTSQKLASGWKNWTNSEILVSTYNSAVESENDKMSDKEDDLWTMPELELLSKLPTSNV